MGAYDEMEDETGAEPTSIEYKKNFYPDSLNKLTIKDLKSPAVLKMVISEKYKNEKEINQLKEFQSKYYKCDKELAVANERIKNKLSTEILSDFVYTVGGIVLAMSTFDFSKGLSINNWIFIVIGLVSILGSAISKWSKK